MTQEKAALKSGISPNTARKYEKLKQLPSDIQLAQDTKEPAHSFVKHWDEITSMLNNSPALMAKTILEYLIEKYPGLYQLNQLRGLQRQIKK